MEAFENLGVWKRSARLCVDLYKALAACADAGFRDQLRRCALSVPSNIAEGYERDSTREYIRFLRIAKGSCGELRTQLYIAKAVQLLDGPSSSRFLQEAGEISRMIAGVIKGVTKAADSHP